MICEICGKDESDDRWCSPECKKQFINRTKMAYYRKQRGHPGSQYGQCQYIAIQMGKPMRECIQYIDEGLETSKTIEGWKNEYGKC